MIPVTRTRMVDDDSRHIPLLSHAACPMDPHFPIGSMVPRFPWQAAPSQGSPAPSGGSKDGNSAAGCAECVAAYAGIGVRGVGRQ